MGRAKISSLLGKITVLFVVCCLIMVVLCVNTALALDGSGTEQDPWRIKSLEDFNDFAADANYWAGFTRLETDVNLAGLTYTTAVIAPDTDNSNYPFDGIAFTGVFDGNDYKIMNLTVNDGGKGNDFVGLFGCIIGGQVRNLGLEGGLVSGDRRVGGLVGSGSGISNCYSKCDVDGFMAVGGLVGVNEYGSISNSHSTGNISGSGGGLVGYNYFGSISNCYSIGSVSGGDVVGGLVGTNGSGTVSNSYSTSSVSGGGFIGGLVGHNTLLADISNCYSTGDVSGLEWIGGLVGWNDYSTVSNCFWDTDTQTHAVTASIGDNDYGTVTNVAGLPTLKMQMRSTFTDADWDFINTWNIGENQTYPYLRTVSPGDINKDHITNFLDIRILCEQWLEEE